MVMYGVMMVWWEVSGERCGILAVLTKTNFCSESGRSQADGDRAAELLARLTGDTEIY